MMFAFSDTVKGEDWVLGTFKTRVKVYNIFKKKQEKFHLFS